MLSTDMHHRHPNRSSPIDIARARAGPFVRLWNGFGHLSDCARMFESIMSLECPCLVSDLIPKLYVISNLCEHNFGWVKGIRIPRAHANIETTFLGRTHTETCPVCRNAAQNTHRSYSVRRDESRKPLANGFESIFSLVMS